MQEAITLKIVKLHEAAIVPAYEHEDDSGMDLCAIAAHTLDPGETALIPTGLAIDAGYRGEVKIILINHGKVPFEVHPGMRIAQMVITPVLRAQLKTVSRLADSRRGQGGFGSTGT